MAISELGWIYSVLVGIRFSELFRLEYRQSNDTLRCSHQSLDGDLKVDVVDARVVDRHQSVARFQTSVELRHAARYQTLDDNHSLVLVDGILRK